MDRKKGNAAMMDPSPSFGETLRQQRLGLGLSQQALGDAVAVSRSAIKEIERGGVRPSLELAGRLAGYLQLTGPDREAFLALARAPMPPVDRAGTPGRPRRAAQSPPARFVLRDWHLLDPLAADDPESGPPYRAFGAFLKQQRLALGLSQQALAAVVQTSRSMIKEIERGQIRPRSPLATRLANFLALAAAAEPTSRACFGDHLKLLRRARGLTQQALAAAVQATRSAIKEIEQGRMRANPALAERLADFFALTGPARDTFLIRARAPRLS